MIIIFQINLLWPRDYPSTKLLGIPVTFHLPTCAIKWLTLWFYEVKKCKKRKRKRKIA